MPSLPIVLSLSASFSLSEIVKERQEAFFKRGTINTVQTERLTVPRGEEIHRDTITLIGNCHFFQRGSLSGYLADDAEGIKNSTDG